MRFMNLCFLMSFLLFAPYSEAGMKPAEFANPTLSTDAGDFQEIHDLEKILDAAWTKASPEGKAILSVARKMINDEEIIVGSCWDYINEVYNRALFTTKKRTTAFKSKASGPYADLTSIKTGDWLYFINHSYGDVEHSGIFVTWMDREYGEALLVSYGGESRQAPARYKTYDLSSVYNVIRPRPAR
jgi:hypothetical protein